MSLSFSTSIFHQCDLIVETTHRQFEDVKQMVKSYELNQQRLVEENTMLHDDITKLRSENELLEKQLWDAKIRIRELCDNEDDRSQGGWTFTTPPNKKESELNRPQRNVTGTPCSGAKYVADLNAEADFTEIFEESFPQQQDSQETQFETQQVLVVEREEQFKAETQGDEAESRPSEEVLDSSTRNIDVMLAMEAHDAQRIEADDDCMSLSSTTAASSSSSSASSLSSCLVYRTPAKSATKKRRSRSVNKWYNSTPKKWRRMLRTHRLQSIFVAGN